MDELAQIAEGKNNSDYHQLAQLLLRLTERIKAFDETADSFLGADGLICLRKLKIWSELVDQARKIIEGLNKMRNSDRMTLSILESHTARFASAALRPVATDLRAIEAELRTSLDPVSRRCAEKLSLILSGKLPEYFEGAAIASLRESQETYKLLN